MSEEDRPYTAAADDFVNTINEGLVKTTERFNATIDYVKLHSNNLRAVAVGLQDLHHLFHEAAQQAALSVIKEFMESGEPDEVVEHILQHGTQLDLTHEYRNLCTFLADRLDWYEVPEGLDQTEAMFNPNNN